MLIFFFLRYEDSVGILGSSSVSRGWRAAAVAITVASSQKKSPESEPSHCRCSLRWLRLSPHSTVWTCSFYRQLHNNKLILNILLMLRPPRPNPPPPFFNYSEYIRCPRQLLLSINFSRAWNSIDTLTELHQMPRWNDQTFSTRKTNAIGRKRKKTKQVPRSYAVSISMN